MTVKEVHIGVDLILQKINSNRVDSFEDQEIDWMFNEEVLRFVKQRINASSNDKGQGFQYNKKRFEDLKQLISPPVTLPAYVRDDNSVFSYLPYNYLILANDRTTTKDLCSGSFSSTSTTTVTKDIVCFTIKDDSSLYSTFKIRINGVTVFDITTIPSISSGLASIESKFELFAILEQNLTGLGYDCKYGTYYETYCGQGIVIVADSSISVEVEYTPSDIITFTSSSKSFTKISAISGTKEVPNRFTDTEKLYDLLASSFGTTIASSPLSTMEGDKLIVFHNKKFIPTSIKITYLKKPRKINLSLNQDCDLDDWIQREIIDNTAKRLAGLVESNTYRNIINENLLKE